MNIKNKEITFYLYAIMSVLLLIGGLFYENAYSSRRNLLIVLIFMYIMSIVITYMGKKAFTYIAIIIAIGTMLVIEYNSKYAINYFFHFVYILLMIYTLIDNNIKIGLAFSSLITLGTFIKFIQLLMIQPTQGNIAMFVFFFIIQILIIIIMVIAKNYWMENDKSTRLYKELLETYKQLEAFSNEIKELTLIEARTKIARDLHDTLGHDMTGLIMQIEMASRLIKQGNTSEGEEQLEGAKKSARDSLAKVRQIVDALKKEGSVEQTNQSINELVNVFATKTNTEINCYITGDKEIALESGVAIYRVVQESLTNAIRHGRATIIQVTIDYLEDKVTFKIIDNGKGCKAITIGNGLKGMEERVRALKGEVTFEHSNGFVVKGHIPYE